MRKLTKHIEGLTCTQGDGAGKPFRVFPWERRFLNGAFQPDVEEAGLCIARGWSCPALDAVAELVEREEKWLFVA